MTYQQNPNKSNTRPNMQQPQQGNRPQQPQRPGQPQQRPQQSPNPSPNKQQPSKKM